MNTCKFTFVSLRTCLPCRVYGVERSWEYLKQEFYRDSDGLPNAKYYETIGPGPQLFAVVGDFVYYHNDEKWFLYISANNIEYGIMDTEE